MKDNRKCTTIVLPTSTGNHCLVGIEANCSIWMIYILDYIWMFKKTGMTVRHNANSAFSVILKLVSVLGVSQFGEPQHSDH